MVIIAAQISEAMDSNVLAVIVGLHGPGYAPVYISGRFDIQCHLIFKSYLIGF